MKRLFLTASFVLALVATGVKAQDRGQSATPAEQYQALLKELQTEGAGYFQTTDDAERQAIVARVDKATVRLLELVEKNPKGSFALSALTQIITQEYWLNTHTSHPGWGQASPQARAIGLLLRDHLDSDKLGETCKRVNFGFRQECETFLRTVLEKNPHREVRGQACLRLAQLLAARVEKLTLLKEQPELAQRYEILFGKDYIEALQRRDQARVMKEAEALYEQASEKYGDVKPPYNETVGEVAKTDLDEIRDFAIGKVAPDIEGADQDGRAFKLSDYRGKVVLLYFWSEY
jgi:AhpC/TSA family